MKAALKYPVFYLAPAKHMVYVFWREENVTTRRLLAEADGWAGQEVVDASGRCYTIRCCWETGPVGLYGLRHRLRGDGPRLSAPGVAGVDRP